MVVAEETEGMQQMTVLPAQKELVNCHIWLLLCAHFMFHCIDLSDCGITQVDLAEQYWACRETMECREFWLEIRHRSSLEDWVDAAEMWLQPCLHMEMEEVEELEVKADRLQRLKVVLDQATLDLLEFQDRAVLSCLYTKVCVNSLPGSFWYHNNLRNSSRDTL
jgi:hypothetical protein